MKVKYRGGRNRDRFKTLVESNGVHFNRLFQGIALRELNWQPLSVLASTIDFVLLTHGHLDHCGWLPRLVDQGFKGKIYCSGPTKEIAKLIF
jgi:metallo-beta-lactamase family protein